MGKQDSFPVLSERYGAIIYHEDTELFSVHPPAEDGSLRESICTTSDWYAAFSILQAWHQNTTRFSLPETKPSIREVFQSFYDFKFGPYAAKKLSDSSRNAWQAAFLPLAEVADLPLDEVPVLKWQDIVNKLGQTSSYSKVSNVVMLIKQLYRYALPREMCSKSYGTFVVMPDTHAEIHREDFTDEELAVLWKNKDHPCYRKTIQMILVMCYSGFRISAYSSLETNLEEGYFKGGIKTSSGKDRIVPIHSSILPFLEDMQDPLGTVVFFDGKSTWQFRRDMKKVLQVFGIDHDDRVHSPHSTRHTFSRLCESYCVRDADRKRMMGHSFGSDLTNAVYGHRSLSELKTEIEKIKTPD